jgi:hypothetical protein
LELGLFPGPETYFYGHYSILGTGEPGDSQVWGGNLCGQTSSTPEGSSVLYTLLWIKMTQPGIEMMTNQTSSAMENAHHCPARLHRMILLNDPFKKFSVIRYTGICLKCMSRVTKPKHHE